MFFGVVLFNEKKYIYKNDTQGVQIGDFDNFRELNRDVIWFSDLSKEEIWRMGCLSILNIKHNQYFNTSFEQIQNTISGNNHKDIKSSLIKILFIFEKIMLLAIHNQSENKFDFEAEELSIAIRNGLFCDMEYEITNVLSDALMCSYQDKVDCLTEEETDELINSNHICLQIKKNGLVYAQELINNLSLPSNNYVIYSLKDIKHQIGLLKDGKPNFDISIQDFFINYLKTPFLVQIDKKTVKSEYEEQRKILDKNEIAYLNAKRIDRVWINSIEFSYLSKFCNFEILNAIVFTQQLNHKEIVELYKLDNVMLNTDNLSYFSIAITLLMENYAIALQEKDTKNHKVNIINSFLAAQDKKELLIISLLLMNNHYKIKSYGRNVIEVLIPDKQEEINKLNNMINKLNYFIF